MVKIKVKKEMELPELLRWASDNDIKGCEINGDQGGTVFFNKNGWVSTPYFLSLDETFEVEVEEEIDEDTIIPTLIELFVNDYGQITHMHFSESINGAIGDVDDDAKALSKAFYILNDDYTITLIWRNGEMVE